MNVHVSKGVQGQGGLGHCVVFLFAPNARVAPRARDEYEGNLKMSQQQAEERDMDGGRREGGRREGGGSVEEGGEGWGVFGGGGVL